MPDQGSIAHDACQLSQGIVGPLITHDSIDGPRDACVLGQGIIGPLFTHDSITGANEANQRSEAYVIRSAILAWYGL